MPIPSKTSQKPSVWQDWLYIEPTICLFHRSGPGGCQPTVGYNRLMSAKCRERASGRVRRIVENGLAAQLCRHRSAALIKRLRTHVKGERTAVAAGDYKEAIALMGEFHLLLAQATGSSVLVTAKAQQNADRYHPLQYLLRDEKAGEG
jgi:hypothetical protein